jgi:hypothetical protein
MKLNRTCGPLAMRMLPIRSATPSWWPVVQNGKRIMSILALNPSRQIDGKSMPMPRDFRYTMAYPRKPDEITKAAAKLHPVVSLGNIC